MSVGLTTGHLGEGQGIPAGSGQMGGDALPEPSAAAGPQHSAGGTSGRHRRRLVDFLAVGSLPFTRKTMALLLWWRPGEVARAQIQRRANSQVSVGRDAPATRARDQAIQCVLLRSMALVADGAPPGSRRVASQWLVREAPEMVSHHGLKLRGAPPSP